jgi:hypothetical protein
MRDLENLQFGSDQKVLKKLTTAPFAVFELNRVYLTIARVSSSVGATPRV